MDQETLDRSLEEMEAACAAYDEQRLLDLLKVLVPEFGEARRGGGERAPSNVVALDRARR